MKKTLFSLIALSYPLTGFMAGVLGSPGDLIIGQPPEGSILGGDKSLIDLLSLVQELLLKVALPIIVVGSAIYIAYQLFTAEGDEARMKQAWKSLTFSAVALVIIALSYALVSIFTGISL